MSMLSLMLLVPSKQLSKGSYYHQPFLLTALCNMITPLFALPFVTASLPHSPQMAESLTHRDGQGKIMHVHENRVAPLLVYALCLGSLYFRRVLEVIPSGVIDGILTFVGIYGLVHNSNQFVQRLLLLFTPKESSSAYKAYDGVLHSKLHSFTLIQLACFTSCWLVLKSPLGICFSLLLVLLVPVRSKLLPSWFTEDELEILDGADIAQHCAPQDLSRVPQTPSSHRSPGITNSVFPYTPSTPARPTSPRLHINLTRPTNNDFFLSYSLVSLLRRLQSDFSGSDMGQKG
eukprot:g66153.t1